VDVIGTADLTEVDGAEHDGLFIAQEHDSEGEQRLADADGWFDESAAQRCTDGWRDIGTERRDLNCEGGDGGEEEKQQRFHDVEYAKRSVRCSRFSVMIALAR
jgi:hypothetical protein